LRFEDVTQDGRLVLEAIPNAFGAAVWRGILAHDPASAALLERGIIPVLSRFVLEGEAGPLAASATIEADGACRLARLADGRIVLDMWASLHAPLGRTYGTFERAGERALVARAYAEHVLTRPFAPPGQRRVTELDFRGAPVLEDVLQDVRPASPAPEAVATLPEGATPLEPAMALDPLAITFGLVHTDSNMHVNSLVYIRLFEEAALRRFVALGRGANVLGRTIDIAYRRPCFAGQTVHVIQRAFEAGGRLGVVAALIDEKDAAGGAPLSAAKPHAYVRLTFE
jgi:hypothetical protein